MQGKTELTAEDWRYARIFLAAVRIDGSKLVILLLCFVMLGYTKEFLTAMLFFALVRSRMGGMHCKSYKSCLIFSFLIFFNSVVLLPKLFSLSRVQGAAILAVCGLLNLILKPALNPTRPVPDDGRLIRGKCMVFFVICLLSVYAVLTGCSSCATAALWVIVHQTALLSLANIKAEKGGEHYVYFRHFSF